MKILTAFAALLIVLATPARAQNPSTTAVRIIRGFGAPVSAQCATNADVSKVYVRLDSASSSSPLYICTNTGTGTYGWQLSSTASIVTGAFYQTVQDEGSALTQRGILNFIGAGVTCVDGTTKTNCTIPAGGGCAASATQVCVGPTGAGSDQFTWTLADSLLNLKDTGGSSVIYATANIGDTNCGVFYINCDGAVPATVGTSTGTRGGLVEFDIPSGGDTSIVTSGTGGSGGGFVVNSGGGASATAAATVSNGGAAGTIQFITGNGGAATVTNSANTGGSGGQINIRAGNAGNATGGGTAVNIAGSALEFSLYGGNGGSASGGASNTGGNGSNIVLKAGARGTGSTANGTSGNVRVQLQNLSDSKFGVNVGGADLFTVDNTGAAIAAALTSAATGYTQVSARSSDPTCAAGDDLGKIWTDSTSGVTTHIKFCVNVASTPTWVSVI